MTTIEHAVRVASVPRIHDPYDRLPIAFAHLGGTPLATNDRVIGRCDGEIVW
jgi:PIN domain nuclease of toxin-antitoxin system